MNFQDFFWGQLYRHEDAKLNGLDLTEFRNHIDYRKFLRDKVIDSSWRTLYTRFRSSQPPASLEITTIAYLTRESYRKRSLLIHHIPFKAHFMRIFAVAKGSLVFFKVIRNSRKVGIVISFQFWVCQRQLMVISLCHSTVCNTGEARNIYSESNSICNFWRHSFTRKSSCCNANVKFTECYKYGN